MPKRLEITVSEELWDRLEAARGFEPRASFVKRALESALGENPAGRQSPASARAPVEKGSAARPSKGGDATSRDLSSGPHAAPARPASGKPSLRDTWSR